MITNNTIKTKKACFFCANGLDHVDYKQVEILRKFTNFYGQILPKRRTGVCSKHQRQLAEAVKRSRIMALMIFTNR
jgi:small subunit ribosomal protein S18